MKTMVADILEGWGWTGAKPAMIVETNKFGNVIFRALDGFFWRICPEELTCEVIADSDDAFAELKRDADFLEDWCMSRLVKEAELEFGAQADGRCFCLKMPAVLGGTYSVENVGTISVGELLRFSGDVAEQIKDIPDGSQVSFKFVE
ncbi:MAG: T6SS immunity protein Tdi1 domain-containing protein [Gammaproteobacteria bacterium]